MKNSSVIRVTLDLDSFFRYWLEFLNPQYKLLESERRVLALLLRERHVLARDIRDDALVDMFLLSKESRARVMKHLPGFKPNNLNGILSSLRKKGILTREGRLDPRVIPSLEQGSASYTLSFIFDIKG
jgi:hypothetical protein